MNSVPPLAWFFIGFIVLFTVSINIWLFSAKKNQQDPKKNNSVFSRVVHTMKDPFAEERNNLQKLSEATAKLRKTSPDQKD